MMAARSGEAVPSLRIVMLVGSMFVSGVLNWIVLKWQDMQCVENCESGSPGEPVYYSQPIWQSLQMFVGETLCLVIFLISRAMRPEQVAEDQQTLLANAQPPSYQSTGNETRRKLVNDRNDSLTYYHLKFFFPATCDILASTIQNLALLIMPVSILQMTRGALVLWVGLVSIMLLRRQLDIHQWFGLVFVMLGVGTMGLTSVLVSPKASAAVSTMLSTTPNTTLKTLLGLVLALCAQVFSAFQLVLEEKFIAEHRVAPLLVVGLEGVFGIAEIGIGTLVLHHFIGSKPQGRGGIFDMRAGWIQTMGVPNVRTSAFVCAMSIAFYNAFAMTVTKYLSATTRSMIDMFRAVGIWVVSIVLGWEILRLLPATLQMLGFASMTYGTFLYNGIVAHPTFLQRRMEMITTV